MLYLLLSIVTSSALVLLFKLFDKKRVNIFQAIVFNYWAATATALLFTSHRPEVFSGAFLQKTWLPLALGLGSLFIIVFNLTSVTTVRFGVSTASVASKLGLVFPVLLAFTVYGEGFSTLKLIGIALAFAAVILTSLKTNNEHHKHGFIEALLPFLVFIGSGACDSLTQFATKNYVGNEDAELFSLLLFFSAALAGTVALAYSVLAKNISVSPKNITWGAVLGFINYFSFLFLLKALANLSWGSSVIFPVNNLGVVAFSSLIGILLFKEKISRVNLVGLLLAAASIITIMLGQRIN